MTLASGPSDQGMQPTGSKEETRHGRPSARTRRAPPPSLALAALLLGPIILLCAGEVRGAAVCSNTPGAGDTVACSQSSGATAVDIDLTSQSISTTATGSAGYAVYGQTSGTATGAVDIDVSGGSLSTTGTSAYSVVGFITNTSSSAALTIDVTNSASLSATGSGGSAILGLNAGSGTTGVTVNDAAVSTSGGSANAVYGWTRGNSAGELAVSVTNGSVSTAGQYSNGILGYLSGPGFTTESTSTSAVNVDAAGVTVTTRGLDAHGVRGLTGGRGAVDVDVTAGATITTTGDRSRGVAAEGRNTASAATGAYSVDLASGTVTVEGLDTSGLYADHRGHGNVTMTTGSSGTVIAPFSVGADAQVANDASAAGRVVVRHEGTVRARDVGILARAERRSGHTRGAVPPTPANDAARTAAMVHVTSSGDVTVGASVTDAFIRSRIAGADNVLSSAEGAVLDAVLAEDSSALTTALAALPGAYDAAWKTAAQELLRKRSAALPSNLQAAELLGVSHAGIRASALPFAGMADYIGRGNQDPTILAKNLGDRTAGDLAQLEREARLSTEEQAVLEAVLEGDVAGLETALAALPTTVAGTYTSAYKDEVRSYAQSFNAGDVRVDVTGGTVTADGNGVEAFYAVRHDGNGAIEVSVDEGARVTGGRNGVYVRGAGAGEGNIHTQAVTVDGAVTGGTGAGVYLDGGGRLTVGATGVVGATSGVGVLADSAGGGGGGGVRASRCRGGSRVTSAPGAVAT